MAISAELAFLFYACTLIDRKDSVAAILRRPPFRQTETIDKHIPEDRHPNNKNVETGF